MSKFHEYQALIAIIAEMIYKFWKTDLHHLVFVRFSWCKFWVVKPKKKQFSIEFENAVS